MRDNNAPPSLFKTIIAAAAVIILMIFAVWRYDLIFAMLGKILSILRPVFIGGGLAFILNAYVNKVMKFWRKDKVSEKTAYRISVVVVYILFLGIMAALVCFVVPQLVSSAEFFFDSFETYYKNFTAWAEDILLRFDFISFDEEKILTAVSDKIMTFSENIPELLGKTLNVTTGIIGAVTDIFIGFIVSVYILIGKNDFKRQFSKAGKALLSSRHYKKASEMYHLVSTTFSHFISGQLTEAVILGVLCFIGMCVFGFDYALLISVIIGSTNLIPIFGPIIGTIPCAFILLLVDPKQAVWFVIFEIILQQLESQLIYPHVVGNSVGLKPFWTLFAILVGGGLFGIAGMIFAVPAMSVIYTLARDFINSKLKDKKRTGSA